MALVLSPDTIDTDVGAPAGKLFKGPVVCILNKMWDKSYLRELGADRCHRDSIHWSEEAFQDFKQAAIEKLKSLGINMDQYVPHLWHNPANVLKTELSLSLSVV